MSDQLRILVVTQYYPPEITAPAFRWGETARCWAETGADVTVLTGFPNYPTGRIDPRYSNQECSIEYDQGVRVVRSWTLPAKDRGFISRCLSQIVFYLSGKYALSDRLPGYDVVVGTSPPLTAAELGSHFAKARNVPFVMEVRDLWPDVIFDTGYRGLRWLRPVLYGWERRLYHRAHHLVSVTSSFIPFLEQKGVAQERISIIHPGMMPNHNGPPPEPPIRDQLGLNGRFVTLYLGNHGISQGLDVVMDAATRVNGNIHFLFVGDGWVKPELIRKAHKLRLKNVTFLPPVPKPITGWFYDMADACLVPLRDSSLMRNFLPSKLIETLGAGKPVITNVGGEGAQIVRESSGGEVLTQFTPTAVADTLKRWSGDLAACRRQGEQGRRYVERHYDRRKLAHRYLDLLARLAGK